MRLLELELIKHPVLGELRIDFTEDKDQSDSMYTTVLIGSNGTGKSVILQTIINIFREAGRYCNNNGRSGDVKGLFHLKYLIDGKVVEISNMRKLKNSDKPLSSLTETTEKTPLQVKVNGQMSRETYFLPVRIIASTMIFTDKFPAVRDLYLPQYHYLGLRNIKSPSTAGTRTVNKNLVNALLKVITNLEFLTSIQNVLSDLEYIPTINVTFIPNYRNLFYGQNLNVETFRRMFTDWRQTFQDRNQEPWGISYYKQIESETSLLQGIVDFLNNKHLLPYGRGGRYISYDLLDSELNLNEIIILGHLQRLDLVRFPTIELKKVDSKFDFNDSSSGEQNIVFSILNILSSIQENSIIFIDEPELSLHPNWQMRYFNILEKVLSRFNNTHFIVSTHSHFLISDLKGENSKIIGLKRDKIIKVVDLPEELNAYGWSAENVLLNVFGVATTRNFYIAEKLSSIFKVAASSKNPNLEEYKEELLKWHKQLKENDPLHYAIEKLIEKNGWLN